MSPATSDDVKKKFYKKVHSTVVEKLIKRCLSATGFADLMLQMDQITFKNATTGKIDHDGPTMRYLIYRKINPDTVVRLDSIEEKLQNVKLIDRMTCSQIWKPTTRF